MSLAAFFIDNVLPGYWVVHRVIAFRIAQENTGYSSMGTTMKLY